MRVKSSPCAFQCSMARRLVEPIGTPDQLGEAAHAKRRHIFANLFGHEEEVIDEVLGLALEARAKDRVLGCDAHRAGVEMALAHHHAAKRDQRRGGEAEFVCAEQRAHQHVASGTERPSTCTATRPRRPFSTSVCCVSASPISRESRCA